MTTGTDWLFIICLKRQGFWPCSSSWHGLWSRETQDQTHLAREAAWKETMMGWWGWETDCSLPFADDFSKLVVGYRNSLPMVCFPPSWKVVSWPMKFLHSSLVVPVTLTMKPISFFKFKRGPYKCVSESSSVLLVVVLSSAQMNIILWADELQLHVYTWLHVQSFAYGCTFVIICVTTTYHYYRHYIFTYLFASQVGWTWIFCSSFCWLSQPPRPRDNLLGLGAQPLLPSEKMALKRPKEEKGSKTEKALKGWNSHDTWPGNLCRSMLSHLRRAETKDQKNKRI